MLHDNSFLVRSFKTAIDQWPSDDFKVLIRADRRPAGEQERRFNALTVDEVALVIVDNEFQSRGDIVLRQRDETLIRVSETHRLYDALQYPLIFCND